jgi:CRP-like cAMP-binding protein
MLSKIKYLFGCKKRPAEAPVHDRSGSLTLEALFKNMSQAERQIAYSYFQEEKISSAAVIINEGEIAEKLYIIEEGEVEVYKSAIAHQREHHLALLKKGECFGEFSLLDESQRSASVRTKTDTSLHTLTKQNFNLLAVKHPPIYMHLLKNLAGSVTQRMRHINEVSVASLEKALWHAKQRVGMGVFMSYSLTCMALFILLVGLMHHLVEKTVESVMLTGPILVIVASIMILMMWQSGYSMKVFGFSLRNWKKNLFQSFWWTLIFMVVLIGFKWVLVRTIPALKDEPIFNWRMKDHHLSFWLAFAAWMGYAVFVPLQEIITRGALQSPLMYFLPRSRYRTIIAIAISTMLFSAMHSYLSIYYSLAVLVPGFFWGALYARQRTLVGVIFSHIVIGVWALEFLNLDRILNM